MQIAQLSHELERYLPDVRLRQASANVGELVQVSIPLPNVIAHQEYLILRLEVARDGVLHLARIELLQLLDLRLHRAHHLTRHAYRLEQPPLSDHLASPFSARTTVAATSRGRLPGHAAVILVQTALARVDQTVAPVCRHKFVHFTLNSHGLLKQKGLVLRQSVVIGDLFSRARLKHLVGLVADSLGG